jgi:hypothetical protein
MTKRMSPAKRWSEKPKRGIEENGKSKIKHERIVDSVLLSRSATPRKACHCAWSFAE